MNLDQMSRYMDTLRTLAALNPRRIREAAGIDQAEMARRLGISPSGVSRIEAGNRKPSPKLAFAWLEELNKLPLKKQPSQRGVQDPGAAKTFERPVLMSMYGVPTALRTPARVELVGGCR